MKKAITVLLLVLAATSCGTARDVDGRRCDTVGIVNSDEKCPGVRYCTIKGNVIWAIVLIETIGVPVYFFGWSIQEPCPDRGRAL